MEKTHVCVLPLIFAALKKRNSNTKDEFHISYTTAENWCVRAAKHGVKIICVPNWTNRVAPRRPNRNKSDHIHDFLMPAAEYYVGLYSASP